MWANKFFVFKQAPKHLLFLLSGIQFLPLFTRINLCWRTCGAHKVNSFLSADFFHTNDLFGHILFVIFNNPAAIIGFAETKIGK
jgi:hypothetical protein